MSKFLPILKDLENNMESFETNFPLAEFKESSLKQHPDITLLTCADSRMPANMFGPIFNRIFSVENIGNQYENNAGSVLYGLIHLHTPLLIVAGHSDCGAIKAALSDFSAEPFPIRRELYALKSTLASIQKTLKVPLSEAEDIRFTELAELNVDKQISYVLINDEVKNLVEKGELAILGVMVDLHNIYQNGYGKIYITNYNGVNNLELIEENLPNSLLKTRIKRLTQTYYNPETVAYI